MSAFSEPTRLWFRASFPAGPTAPQQAAWDTIAGGSNALVVAPTGSGKTLAAFLSAIDSMLQQPTPPRAQRCRVLYISPLKALGVDVERNLRSPLVGIGRQAQLVGATVPELLIGTRTGDTPAQERRRMATRPPDVLITTPESLFLILTSAAREILSSVQTVIIDEVHAMAGTKRGAHLAVSLERIARLTERPPQRIGLSATVRPVDEVARFVGGSLPVQVVQVPSDKKLDLRVEVPLPDMTDPSLGAGTDVAHDEVADTPATQKDIPDGPALEDDFYATGSSPEAPRDPAADRSVWPHVEARISSLISGQRSTLVFANSRRLAERLTSRLNEMADLGSPAVPSRTSAQPAASVMAQAGSSEGAPAKIARAHHGSVSKEQRAEIEDLLKTGGLPAVVATSSLELGIDMGAIDLVAQVAAPPSVAAGLQRIGRAGHQVGAVSRGVFFPKHRGDLLNTAVVAEQMLAGNIEALHVTRNPLDVLAQHIVSMVAMDTWDVADMADLFRASAPFATLPDSGLNSVLDMLSGRYPADDFATLRPRLNWDRGSGELTSRPGSQSIAVTSGGTIPDRGLFGVYLASGAERGGKRVGELDEEMVYESRVGDVFSLGATSWRIEGIDSDRVHVSPAPGVPGKLPFWHGDAPGRPYELGARIGTFIREVSSDPDPAPRLARAGLDQWATDNLMAYLREQSSSTGRLPDDRTVVVERFRDELGDWRVVIHSLFGARVNAAWALALASRLRAEYDVDAQVMAADEGIIARIPDTGDESMVARISEMAFIDPEDITAIVTSEVAGTALFAARFRECAARSLLLPRKDPGRRSPLWQQRQRSAQLLTVASRFPTFPVTLETMRECLQDVYDLPALEGLLGDIRSGRVRVVDADTATPSPFARSLLMAYVAAFMYEGDSPLAERRAAALTLDTEVLAELLGQADLRELLDPDAVAQVISSLQWLTDPPRVRDVDSAADLLRVVGPLTTLDAQLRGAEPQWMEQLCQQRRAFSAVVAGQERFCAAEDAARLRDGLGVVVPPGLANEFLEPVADAVGDLVARYARTHGPFTVAEACEHLGLPTAVVDAALAGLAARNRVVSGEFLPERTGTEWCGADVLRRIRRASVAALQRQAEPLPQSALAGFLSQWQQVAPQTPSKGGISTVGLSGIDGLLTVVDQLAGFPLAASTLETQILPQRLKDYRGEMLDELLVSGEVEWWGCGSLPGRDGWLMLAPSDLADAVRDSTSPTEPSEDPVELAVLEALRDSGGWFLPHLAAKVAQGYPDIKASAVLDALWGLVWSGQVTNDTLGPLRAWPAARSRSRSRGQVRPRPRPARLGSRPTGRVAAVPAHGAGRWSAVPSPRQDPASLIIMAERLLARHGIVVRGSLAGERVPGGFAASYRLLSQMDELGRCRRSYVLDGLGGAQFAAPGAIDRIRSLQSQAERDADAGPAAAIALAAIDPANPFGAALAWPDFPGDHHAGRKVGASVVIVDGLLTFFLERGGKSLLAVDSELSVLQRAAQTLSAAVASAIVARPTITRINGHDISEGEGLASPTAAALLSAGFVLTPKGLRAPLRR